MNRKFFYLFSYFLMISSLSIKAQSPTSPALNFNTFILKDATFTTSEMEGPLAIGKDLHISGNYSVSIHNPGTFLIGGKPIALLVNGKAHYNSGTSFHVLQNGYAKIGDCGNSKVWYQDLNNAYPPIRITPDADYNSFPRIEFNQNAQNLGVSATNNPICQSSDVDFEAAFDQLKINALSLSTCDDNAVLKTSNGTLLTRTNLPHQVKIHLQTGANILNISGEELNNLDELIFENYQPDVNRYLIINIDNQSTNGIFNWDVYNTAGHGGFENCKYILYNFYNATQINIVNSSAAIAGTIFAPFADIIKNNSSNLDGQVIANSYIQNGGGEIHYAIFMPDNSGCGIGSDPTTAEFSINKAEQCLRGNNFNFTNTSTGDIPLSFRWNFGDGTFSSLENPSKIYTDTGTYTVTLIVEGTDRTDTAMLTLNVQEMPYAIITVNNNLQELINNEFIFNVQNPKSGDSYFWNFGDQSTSNVQNPKKHYVEAGSYNPQLIIKNENLCADTAKINVFVISDSVGSGNEGGLESGSLAGLVGKRDFNRLKYSINTSLNYDQMPLFSEIYGDRTQSTQLKLADMMPQSLGKAHELRISTPSDLLYLTAAQEVISIDYTLNNRAQAVVLGIKTLDKVYSHTKSICDRFKGATLTHVENVKIKGFDFLRFTLKNENGNVEYAIAFVVGQNKNEEFFSLQTNWLISSYMSNEEVFNFQVWSTRPDYTDQLVENILNNLESTKEIIQNNPPQVPRAYITYGKREKENLIISIHNNTSLLRGKVIFEERKNEQSDIEILEIPLKLSKGQQEFEIPIQDGYEYQGSLYLEETLVDEVYMADGNWGIDYDPEYTSIVKHEVGNNFSRAYKNKEFPLYRNVNLEAISNDYIIIYKAIRSGTEAANLEQYHSLKFFAKGTGLAEVVLTKESIKDWNSQYKFDIKLDEKGREYVISLNDFLSKKIISSFKANDLKTISFSFISESGRKERIDFQVDNIVFSKEKVMSQRGLDSKEIQISPNPSIGNFSCTFNSENNQTLTLQIMDITGKVLYSKEIIARRGQNTIPIQVDLPSSVVLIALKGKDIKYEVQKLIIE